MSRPDISINTPLNPSRGARPTGDAVQRADRESRWLCRVRGPLQPQDKVSVSPAPWAFLLGFLPEVGFSSASAKRGGGRAAGGRWTRSWA